VLGSTVSGFYKKGLKFFSILVPSGCPLGLLPLLVLIELISYIARHLSLGLRLAANITAGHMLLYILSGFTYNMIKSYVFPIWILPLIGIASFSGLEVGIAIIQAQVFVVLSSSYIKDGI
jgi:F-type H+-transporting ATPase subunit a